MVLSVSLAFNVAATLFLGHLIYFHFYLQRIKVTTFEYIQIKMNKTHKSKIFRQVKQETEKNDEGPEVETDNNGTN